MLGFTLSAVISHFSNIGEWKGTTYIRAAHIWSLRDSAQPGGWDSVRPGRQHRAGRPSESMEHGLLSRVCDAMAGENLHTLRLCVYRGKGWGGASVLGFLNLFHFILASAWELTYLSPWSVISGHHWYHVNAWGLVLLSESMWERVPGWVSVEWRRKTCLAVLTPLG